MNTARTAAAGALRGLLMTTNCDLQHNLLLDLYEQDNDRALVAKGVGVEYRTLFAQAI